MDNLIPTHTIMARDVVLMISFFVGAISCALCTMAWRHSRVRAVGFISLMFLGWTIHSLYFGYWYWAGRMTWTYDFLIMPNLASMVMNVAAIGFLYSIIREPIPRTAAGK